jgi:hypothetical protein
MNIPRIVLSIEERQALNEEICNAKNLKHAEHTGSINIDLMRVDAVITNFMILKHQFETNGPHKEEAREKLLIIYKTLAEQGYCK